MQIVGLVCPVLFGFNVVMLLRLVHGESGTKLGAGRRPLTIVLLGLILLYIAEVAFETMVTLSQRLTGAEPATQFLVPATVVPVATQVDLVVGYDHEMERAGVDRAEASRAEVLLGGCVGLDRGDRHPERIAHAMAPTAAANPMTMIAMSVMVLSESRNGLKPMCQR